MAPHAHPAEPAEFDNIDIREVNRPMESTPSGLVSCSTDSESNLLAQGGLADSTGQYLPSYYPFGLQNDAPSSQSPKLRSQWADAFHGWKFVLGSCKLTEDKPTSESTR